MAVTQVTARKKARFIEHLAKTGNVSRSCEFAGVSRNAVYQHKNSDSAFKSEWEDAEAQYLEKLEAEADRRALEGVRKKIFHKGEPVIDPESGEQYTEQEYSDTLLIFRMKALAPDKYRDNSKVEHAGEIAVKRVVIDKSAKSEPDPDE